MPWAGASFPSHTSISSGKETPLGLQQKRSAPLTPAGSQPSHLAGRSRERPSSAWSSPSSLCPLALTFQDVEDEGEHRAAQGGAGGVEGELPQCDLDGVLDHCGVVVPQVLQGDNAPCRREQTTAVGLWGQWRGGAGSAPSALTTARAGGHTAKLPGEESKGGRPADAVTP